MSTSVFFFGGFKASEGDIDKWVRSARQQKPTVGFTGFPWKAGPDAYPADLVVKGAKKSGQFQSAVDTIKACTAETIYIVGHSSGCAVSNAVDKELKNPDIVLVALDGYGPGPDQLKRKTTQVWGAMSGKVKSKNFPGWSDGRQRIYQAAANCKALMALHFVLVNAASTDDKVRNIPTGYTDCEANLVWLS